MKVFSLFVILVGFFSLSSSAQTIEPAPADKSVVYFVRPGTMGFAINFSYFDSTKLIGKFDGLAYIRYTCEPGEHLFWARSENRDFVEANLAAGKIYFIEAQVKMGFTKAVVKLMPADPEEGDRMRKLVRFIGTRDAESFPEERLEELEKKMDDVIVKAMEEYAEKKADGRIKYKLEEDMYYRN